MIDYVTKTIMERKHVEDIFGHGYVKPFFVLVT